MEGDDCTSDGACSRFVGNKSGTPNKRKKIEYYHFLIPLLMDQAQKGLKYVESFKWDAFVFAAIVVNTRFKINFSTKTVENHNLTFKARYAEIKKAKDLNGVRWDDTI